MGLRGLTFIALWLGCFFQGISQPSEKLLLVFNQNKFIPGDTIWFSAYLMDKDLSLFGGKQIMEANLVDGNGDSMSRIYFNIKDGIGINQMRVPEELPAGIYYFTIHQSSFPLEQFRKKLTIVEDDKIVLKQAKERGVKSRVNYGYSVLKADIEADKERYKTRDKVRLVIKLPTNQNTDGICTIKVLNGALFDEDSIDHFISGFQAVQEVIKFRSSGHHGTTSNSWIYKKGMAYHAETSEPLPDSSQIVFYLQKSQMRYQAFTKEEGLFDFQMLDFYGKDNFFYMAEVDGKRISDLKIEWSDNKVAFPKAPGFTKLEQIDPYADFALKRNLINKSYGFYHDNALRPDQVSFIELNNRLIKQIGGADITIDVQKYIDFPSVEQLIKSVVNSLRVIEVEGSKDIRLKYIQNREFFGNPLYIIDGVATDNCNFFLSMNPKDILTIKVVRDLKKLARFGILGRNGVIIVETLGGDGQGIISDPSGEVVGLSPSLAFEVPDYAQELNPDVPDFRSTIYWEPNVELNKGTAEIEFFTSDDAGELFVTVEGVTKDGRLIFGTSKLEIMVRD